MTADRWQAKDHEIALDFVQDNETEARSSAILETRNGVTVILPAGLPALGLSFHGGFMTAPLLLFTAALVWLLTAILWGGSAPDLNRALIGLLAVALLYGLYRALKLLWRSRELFPRRHFVTLSPRGAAMHFAKWQLPLCAAKTALSWPDVKSIATDRVFFLPALGLGTPWVPALRLDSHSGAVLRIPFHPAHNAGGALEAAIREHIKTMRRAAPAA